MQQLETDTSPFGSHWGEKEQNISASISLMSGTTLSHDFRIPAFMDNPVSCAQADGNGSMSSTPSF